MLGVGLGRQPMRPNWTKWRRAEPIGPAHRASCPVDGTVEPWDGFRLRRASAPTETGHSVTSIAFCVIAQGRKEIRLGKRTYGYDPAQYLIVTNALPVSSRITEASTARPFLNLVLRLDPTFVGSVLVEVGRPAPRAMAAPAAIDVSPIDPELLDATVRLVRLADRRTTPACSRR